MMRHIAASRHQWFQDELWYDLIDGARRRDQSDLAFEILSCIEQPLQPHDLQGHARLRAVVSVAVGTGEDEWSVESYRRLIRAQGVDVVQMDPGRCQGITGSDVIKLIEAENLHNSAHTWSSALNRAASAICLDSARTKYEMTDALGNHVPAV